MREAVGDVGHHQPGSVPGQKLQSVTPLRPENHDHTRIDVETELSRRRRRESVMAPAKINRPGRHHDAKRGVGENHDARPSPKARATIRSTGLSTGRRMTTPSASIATAWSGDAPSTTSGTNGAGTPSPVTSGRAPSCARRRHLRSVFSLTPWRRETSEIEAPGRWLSATIRAFRSSGQGRPRPGRGPQTPNGAPASVPLTAERTPECARRRHWRRLCALTPWRAATSFCTAPGLSEVAPENRTGR